jgi:hypothetical protein
VCSHRKQDHTAVTSGATLKLNHINLCSTDVNALSAIFCSHFDFKVVQTGKVPETFTNGPLPPGSAFAILLGTDGFSLIITEIGPNLPKRYPTDFHVGFTVDAPDQVYAKYKELTEAGRDPDPINSFEAMGKTWTAFYCSIGDGIKVEVNASV